MLSKVNNLQITDLSKKIVLKLTRVLCDVAAFNSLRIRLGGSLQDQVTYKVGSNYGDCRSFQRDDGGLFGFTDGCLEMNRWDELNVFFKRTK
jgi:heparanase 1